ncbi:MAG: hypothetical protein J6M12_06515 [Clostridia bacterium]|nr:hypothetical protein [Clostridia bacterium]
MKKSIRILAAVLVGIVLCLCLASCGGGLNGEYESKVGSLGLIRKTVKFDGDNVTVKYLVSDLAVVTVEGTYTIEDDKITFNFSNKDGAEHKDAEEYLETLRGELSFEQGDGYVKIGGVTYTKVKK